MTCMRWDLQHEAVGCRADLGQVREDAQSCVADGPETKDWPLKVSPW